MIGPHDRQVRPNRSFFGFRPSGSLRRLAQDTRNVHEPLIPLSCAILKAHLKSPCGDRNAFLSGPLDLMRGVTLVIRGGVTLYASPIARDYDREPGVCGTITEKGHGCRAVLNGDNVEGAGAMGDGVIDGRGSEKILGQSMSW